MRGGELHRLHGELDRGAADHDRQMIRRAGRGAEGEHLLLEEGEHAVVRQDRGRRLEQKRLVGRAAAFGDEQKLIGVLALGVDLDLRRHVVLGVLLLEHGDRRELRIAQIALEVGVARALGERGLVGTVAEHQAALLAHDDGGAGVLAHRQHAAGGDVGVLQEIVGDELVVGGGLGVVEDRAQLLEVRRAQQMIDVGEGGLGERAQRLVADHQHVLAHHLFDAHAADVELAVGRLVRPERKQRRVVVRGDGGGWGEGGVHGEPLLSVRYKYHYISLANAINRALIPDDLQRAMYGYAQTPSRHKFDLIGRMGQRSS